MCAAGTRFSRWAVQLQHMCAGTIAGRGAGELAEKYGARFQSPAYLVEKAESGGSF